MSFEFTSDSGIHFIKDLSIYNGISLEKNDWNKRTFHRIKLYYYKSYVDCDGCISVNKDYDYFDFKNQDEAIEIFSDLKRLLENKQSDKQ